MLKKCRKLFPTLRCSMGGRQELLSLKMYTMKITQNRRMKGARGLTLPSLALTAAASLALALGISACEQVASYTQPSL